MLVGKCDGAIVASVMVGHDGHRGWVYYVTVDPDRRHQNFGRAIMDAAEEWLRERGIDKLQLMVRKDNAQVHAFYKSIGYYNQETRDLCQMARRPRADAVARDRLARRRTT